MFLCPIISPKKEKKLTFTRLPADAESTQGGVPESTVEYQVQMETVRKHLDKSAEDQRYARRQCGSGGHPNRDAAWTSPNPSTRVEREGGAGEVENVPLILPQKRNRSKENKEKTLAEEFL